MLSSDRLLIACSSKDPFSVIIVDPTTGVSSWSYKGAELQGGAIGVVTPLGYYNVMRFEYAKCGEIGGSAKLLPRSPAGITCTISSHMACKCISGDHLLVTIKDRPLIHAFAVHPRDRYHHRTVVGGVVSALCTCRDGSLLYVAIGTQIFVWLLTSGELLAVVDAHYQSITRLSLSSDESILFSASTDGVVSCYLVSDLVSQDRNVNVQPLRKWRAHTLAVRGLSVSCGGNPRVVSCGLDHVATIHSISLDDMLLKISADRPLTACELDLAESRLFLGSDNGNIVQINLYALEQPRELLVQVADEKKKQFPVFKGHNDEITSLAISGDGSLLASGDSSGKYCIWEINSRQCLKDFWHEHLDRMIANVVREASMPLPSGGHRKKKKRKRNEASDRLGENLKEEDVLLLDHEMDVLDVKERLSSSITEASCTNDKELIEKQRQEILKLKRINAELYEFMAKELTGK